MRELSQELQNPHILKAFFMKVFFDAGEVDFLVILPSDINQVKAQLIKKNFMFLMLMSVFQFFARMIVCIPRNGLGIKWMIRK